jgi:ankyrin repeat protein
VYARSEFGGTPLHSAAFSETPENIRILLEAGANVNARNETGTTPLHGAAGWGTPENIRILLEAGANVNARRIEDGRTPLHYAAAYGTPENVFALLELGADGTAEDEFGQTPFDLVGMNPALRGTDAYWALNEARFR